MSELASSRAWYERVFGLDVIMEFPDDDGVVRGVAGNVPGLEPGGIALRVNVAAADGLRGYDPIAFGVADRAAIDAWIAHLDAIDVEHSPVIEASIGWIVSFHDPDGTEIRLYSWEQHGDDPETP